MATKCYPSIGQLDNVAFLRYVLSMATVRPFSYLYGGHWTSRGLSRLLCTLDLHQNEWNLPRLVLISISLWSFLIGAITSVFSHVISLQAPSSVSCLLCNKPESAHFVLVLSQQFEHSCWCCECPCKLVYS